MDRRQKTESLTGYFGGYTAPDCFGEMKAAQVCIVSVLLAVLG
jgi:hypothetical protein